MSPLNDSWVFINRPHGLQQSDKPKVGSKLASVSLYSNTPILHLRRYFDEKDLQFPSTSGISMTKRSFENLLTLQGEILAAFDEMERGLQTLQTNGLTSRPDTIQASINPTAKKPLRRIKLIHLPDVPLKQQRKIKRANTTAKRTRLLTKTQPVSDQETANTNTNTI